MSNTISIPVDFHNIPIKTGDGVFDFRTNHVFRVIDVSDDGAVRLSDGCWVHPSTLTHLVPDSMETVLQDAKRDAVSYLRKKDKLPAREMYETQSEYALKIENIMRCDLIARTKVICEAEALGEVSVR